MRRSPDRRGESGHLKLRDRLEVLQGAGEATGRGSARAEGIPLMALQAPMTETRERNAQTTRNR